MTGRCNSWKTDVAVEPISLMDHINALLATAAERPTPTAKSQPSVLGIGV